MTLAMTGIQWHQLEWIHLCWAVLGSAALLALLARRRGSVLDRVLNLPMQERLVRRPARARRLLRGVCLTASALCMVLALCRPQWGHEYVEAPRVGAELMICLDVSRSMLAEDVAPHRLGRAREEIKDLLSYLDGDHVGLIAFAGNASVACPLTPDFGFLRLVLDELGPHSVQRGGTQLAEPIRKALAGFAPGGETSRAILLVTDGEDHDSFPLDVAREAAERGIPIIGIGFGDEAGVELAITDPRTGARTTVRDADGAAVRTRLDGETLRGLASATQGYYIPAGTGVLDLESIVRERLAPLARGQLSGRGRLIAQEGYPWMVLAALLALVAGAGLTGLRRGALATVGLFEGTATTRTRHPAARAHAEARSTPARASTAATTSARTRTATAARVVLLVAALPAASLANTPAATGAAVTDAFEAAGPDSSGAASETDSAAASGTAASDTSPDAATEVPAALTLPADPRACHNDGLARLLAGELDAAEELLRGAHRQASTDREARVSALYHLGWVAVKRSEQLIESDPRGAHEQLQVAADWFRQTLRQQPEDADARHNLEVVLRRALALADQLREHNEKDLAARLDALTQRQRAHGTQLRELVERAAALTDPGMLDSLQPLFRAAAQEQRALLSETTALAGDARTEGAALEARPDEERTPEDGMRVVQLANLQHYLHRAQERQAQARQQLRRKQAERAFRRGAAALTELKRARDQLRDPAQVLGALVTDTTEAARQAGTLAGARRPHAPAQDAPPAAPAWLTDELLGETAAALAERTGELGARLAAGLEAHRARDTDDATTQPDGADAIDPDSSAGADVSPAVVDPQEAELVAAVEAAVPLVESARAALARAAEQAATRQPEAVLAAEAEALDALARAHELFLDLRGLIELAYRTQATTGQVLDEREPAGFTLAELAPQLVEIAHQNAVRMERIDGKLAQELAALESADAAHAAAGATAGDPGAAGSGATGPGAGDAADTQAERERLIVARQLAGQARSALADLGRALETVTRASGAGDADTGDTGTGDAGTGDADAASTGTVDGGAGGHTGDPTGDATGDPTSTADRDLDGARVGDRTGNAEAGAHAEPAVRAAHASALAALEQLRRLFFDLLEHLADTARRQAELNDATETATTLTQAEALDASLGPLLSRQHELALIAGEIATALATHAEQAAGAASGATPAGPGGPTDPAAEEQLARVRQAGTHVRTAVGSMEAAQTTLGTPAPERTPEVVAGGRKHQDEALASLLAALALLSPPPPPEESQDESQDGDSQDGQQDQQAGAEESEDPQQSADSEQTLQGIRDREAARRKEREASQRGRYEPVGKDW